MAKISKDRMSKILDSLSNGHFDTVAHQIRHSVTTQFFDTLSRSRKKSLSLLKISRHGWKSLSCIFQAKVLLLPLL